LKDCLIETYRIQKKFPEGRASVTVLGKLADGLYKKPQEITLSSKSVPEIIAILRKLTLLREDVTPEVFLLLDILLKRIQKQSEKRAILGAIMEVVSGKGDQSYQLIWFYRLCLSHAPGMCNSILRKNSGPILKVIERGAYSHDYEIFPSTNFTKVHKIELQKFTLVDQKKLNEAKGKSINPLSINPFRY
jgi:hypothetical protein